jgi:hypothetical protein
MNHFGFHKTARAIAPLVAFCFLLVGWTKPISGVTYEESPSPRATISEDAAVKLAGEYLKDHVAPHESDVAVRKEGDDYCVMHTLKKKVMGGAVDVWIDGKTGRMIKSDWYQ